MPAIIPKLNLIAFITLIGFFINIQSIKAQDPVDDKKAQLESQKVAFITNKLKLTVSEAQKFWPVYNEYQQKRQEIIVKRRELLSKIRLKVNQYSDDELTKLADDYIQTEIKESNLAAEYHTKFKEVLSIKKLIEYYKAEEQFKVWLLNEMKRNAPNQKGNKP